MWVFLLIEFEKLLNMKRQNSKNRKYVSFGNIKVSQTLVIFFSGIFLLSMFTVVVLDFSLTVLCIFLLALGVLLCSHYFNSNVWNIWYEGDYLYFENIKKSFNRDIELFYKIEKSGFLGIFYIIYLKNKDSVYFKADPLNHFWIFAQGNSNIHIEKLNEK